MTNLTPVDTFTLDVETPDEGEEVTAAAAGAGKGPVRPGFQKLYNRTVALHGAELLQSLVPRVQLAWAAGVGLDLVEIRSLGRIALIDSLGKRYFDVAGASSIGPSTLEGGGAADWPASSWVYLYAYASGAGTVAYETSTTAPLIGSSGALIQKTGDATRRYLGCFRTDGSTPRQIHRFRADRGTYLRDAFAPLVQSGSGTGAFVVVNAADVIPPHVRQVRLYAEITSTGVAGGNNPGALIIRRASGAPEKSIPYPLTSIGFTHTGAGEIDLILDAARTLECKLPVAGGGNILTSTIAVVGWKE